jgi:hypothetical protein
MLASLFGMFAIMTNKDSPPGWDEERIRRALSHYEQQTDKQAADEDEAAFKGKKQTVVQVPAELVPIIREMIAQYQATAKA